MAQLPQSLWPPSQFSLFLSLSLFLVAVYCRKLWQTLNTVSVQEFSCRFHWQVCCCRCCCLEKHKTIRQKQSKDATADWRTLCGPKRGKNSSIINNNSSRECSFCFKLAQIKQQFKLCTRSSATLFECLNTIKTNIRSYRSWRYLKKHSSCASTSLAYFWRFTALLLVFWNAPRLRN